MKGAPSFDEGFRQGLLAGQVVAAKQIATLLRGMPQATVEEKLVIQKAVNLVEAFAADKGQIDDG